MTQRPELPSYEQMTPDQKLAWQAGAEAGARPRLKRIEELEAVLRRIDQDQREGAVAAHLGWLARRALHRREPRNEKGADATG